jgi:hypothetical protein
MAFVRTVFKKWLDTKEFFQYVVQENGCQQRGKGGRGEVGGDDTDGADAAEASGDSGVAGRFGSAGRPSGYGTRITGGAEVSPGVCKTRQYSQYEITEQATILCLAELNKQVSYAMLYQVKPA